MSRNPRRRKPNIKGRNETEAFIPIPQGMARSAAFRSLSGAAVKVWVELRSAYNGYNNGQLSLSYQRAADLLGMSKSTVRRAFKELVAKGFIRLRRPGHWYGRRAAEYIVTDRSFDGQLPTRDWQLLRDFPHDKKQKSVPTRPATPRCEPGGTQPTCDEVQDGTRQPMLRVVHGAT